MVTVSSFCLVYLLYKGQFFSNHLNDQRMGTLCQNLCQFLRIVRTVLQYTDFNQFSCVQRFFHRFVSSGVMLFLPI